MVNQNLRWEVKSLEKKDLQEIALSQEPDVTGNLNYEVIKNVLYTATTNIDDQANWKNKELGQLISEILSKADEKLVSKILLTQFFFPQLRPKVLMISSKYNYSEVQDKFISILKSHGDQEMAEDFVVFGTEDLKKSGEKWLQRSEQPETRKLVRMIVTRLSDTELTEIEKMLRRGDPVVNELKTIDSLVYTGALCLNESAQWINPKRGRHIYDILNELNGEEVGDSLARHVLFRPYRPNLLFLGVKLGLPGSEEKLNRILSNHGDKSMAEDFLNSGSPALSAGGREWARRQGYTILPGPGSHRVNWGRF